MSSQNVDPTYTSSKNVKDHTFKTTDKHSVTKRLQKELMALMSASAPGISAFPDGSNLFKWIGTIVGAPSTVYGGLTFKLSLEFPASYPYDAPIVKFVTPCYHPNVDNLGNICLDILKDEWSALYDVSQVLISIQSLLSEPNNDSPLNGEAAQLWNKKDEFKKRLMANYNADAKIAK